MFSGNDVVLPNDIVIPTDIVMPSILCRISTGDTRLWKNAGTVCSVFFSDQLITSILCVFSVGCNPTAHGSLPEEPRFHGP